MTTNNKIENNKPEKSSTNQNKIRKCRSPRGKNKVNLIRRPHCTTTETATMSQNTQQCAAHGNTKNQTNNHHTTHKRDHRARTTVQRAAYNEADLACVCIIWFACFLFVGYLVALF